MTLDIDLADLDRFARGVPHEWFDRLRAEAPVYWNSEGSGPGFWVVTRHADVTGLNKDWQRFSSTAGISPEGHGAAQDLGMLTMDPPRQTKYRALVSQSFMPRAIAKLEDRVREAFRPLLDEFIANGGGDFVEQVAGPFPVRVICELMGVAQELEQDIYRWSNAIVPSQDPEYWVSEQHAEQANASFASFSDDLVETKRRCPGNDLTSELVSVELDGRPLERDELRAFVRLIVIGGAETTRHLISHMALLLAENDEQRRRVVSGEVAAELAVEEMFRFASPVMHHARWATEDTEVRGQKIRKGDRVTLWMVSANRDPDAFEAPHDLDVGRTPNWHVALGGGGPHYCLGAHLSRLEARVALEGLTPHLDQLRLTAPVDRLRSTFFNGIKHLELARSD